MAKNTNKKIKRERHALALARKEKREYVYVHEEEEDPNEEFFQLLYSATGGENPWMHNGELHYYISNHIYYRKYDHYQRRAVNRLIRVFKRWRMLSYDKNYVTPPSYYEDDDRVLYQDATPACLHFAINVANFKSQWRKEPEHWKPVEGHSTSDQLSSLLRFLLTQYEVPKFFDKVWLQESKLHDRNYKKHVDPDKLLKQQWFINIGNGENIRTQKGLPITLTKRMAHLLNEVDEGTTIKRAFRWVQLTALGIRPNTINGVMSLPISNKFENDEFWLSVIRFFNNSPFMAVTFYRTVYDFINHKKFSETQEIIDNVVVTVPPEIPNFSMNGRNPAILTEQINEWHNEIAVYNDSTYQKELLVWDSCGIKGFSTEGKGKNFVILEFRNTADLIKDGREMNHCVATYDRSCKDGGVAVFSLQSASTEGDAYVREVTIEVQVASRQISQALRSSNRELYPKDKELLRMWAKVENLTIESWVM